MVTVNNTNNKPVSHLFCWKLVNASLARASREIEGKRIISKHKWGWKSKNGKNNQKHTQKQTSNIDGVIYEILKILHIWLWLVEWLSGQKWNLQAKLEFCLHLLHTNVIIDFIISPEFSVTILEKTCLGDPLDIKIELLNTMTDKSPFNPSQISF